MPARHSKVKSSSRPKGGRSGRSSSQQSDASEVSDSSAPASQTASTAPESAQERPSRSSQSSPRLRSEHMWPRSVEFEKRAARSSAMRVRALRGPLLAFPLQDAPEILYISERVGYDEHLNSSPKIFEFELDPRYARSLHMEALQLQSERKLMVQRLLEEVVLPTRVHVEVLYFDGRTPEVYCVSERRMGPLPPQELKFTATDFKSNRLSIGIVRKQLPISSAHSNRPF